MSATVRFGWRCCALVMLTACSTSVHGSSGSYSAPSLTAVATAATGSPVATARTAATGSPVASGTPQASPSATVYVTHLATHGYPTNARGQTYGLGPVTGHDGYGPQLVGVTGVGGVFGYIRSSDMKAAMVMDWTSVKLYAVDGVTVVGTYNVGGAAQSSR
jgi:hypothetical protein